MKKGFLILFIALLAGCNQNQDTAEQRNDLIHVKNTSFQEEVDRENGQVIAERLVDIASRDKNVKNATAVVLGRYAIVGIDVDPNLERSEVGSIKYSVAESLKHDPYGAQAAIVADPDTTARIRELAADIRAGEPAQGIMNELADISGRLMPEVPADIIDPNPKNGTEKPKNKQNVNDNKELEKEQQQQSKNQKK
ncbi:YhcN/YlaJ family sporulation lipoprotein [Bacillaceae bacterium Marseille-Q3522]|nr:YhcN/YlaJ family sporulation lipoprotein [Bacillaceae bacterium Marseille-Q3522]